MIVGLAACSPRDRSVDLPPIPSTPQAGGRLVVAIQADGRTLDPHRATDAGSMRLIENLYGTLMRYTAVYGEVEPYLARSVEISPDQTSLTFDLHTNVVFHHSHRPMTSGDIKFSIRRIIDEQVRAEQFSEIASIETPAPDRVVIHLERPVAPFLTYLAVPMNAIVDREIVEEQDGSLDRVAAGTGPFRLREWRRDQHLIMERHPLYHIEDRPFLDEVVFRPISDETARTTALRNREIDLMLDVPDRDRHILERTGYIFIDSVPGTFWEYIGLNTRRPPFNDIRVRQAVASAIDRQMINQLVKFGRAETATGEFLPTNHWAHTGLELFPKPDLDRARALLAEAGFADGLATHMRVGSAFPYQVAAAQIVKQQLLQIGIDVELLSQESSVFFDALNQGDFEMTLVGWLGFVDPDEWFFNIFSSEGVWNQQGYSNSHVDDWLREARAENDLDIRRQLYRDIQETILTEAPVVLLYINEQASARLHRVQGYQVHPTATTLSLRDTWLIQ